MLQYKCLASPPFRSLPPPPRSRYPDQSLFHSWLFSEKIWSPDRVQSTEGDPLRADPEAARVCCLPIRERAAPVLQSPVARLGSQEIRYRAAVALRAIPGWKRTGKPLCTFPRSVGWARSGSVYRQVSPADGRAEGAREPLGRRTPAVPGAGTHLTTAWRGAPTAAVEAVLCFPGRTGAGAAGG